MSPALLVLGATLAGAFALGLAARRGRRMDLEQWAVGGRRFGAALVFLLLAGEIYTTFTFLGGSGWAYGRGAPAFYILSYGAIGFAISYFLLPVIWRHARRHGLHSQADFFVHQYRSHALGVLVALVGVAAMLPYLVLQLKGLGYIVSEVSYGAIPVAAAVWLSVAALVAYVVISGVHGSAWTAVAKDVLILAVAVGLGLYLPVHHYGGYGEMFARIEQAHPGFFQLPARGLSPSWFVSTVILTGIGFWTWPHAFAATYTARSAAVFRRNAVVMPLYQLVLLFVFLAGFAAVLKVPGLTGAESDLSLLRLAKLTFGPWVVGVIGAAGLLTALVPGSMLLLAAATILAKNVFGGRAAGGSAERQGRLARGLVPVLALVAVGLTLRGGEAIVPLLLLGYSLVTQLLPALLLALGETPRTSAAGAAAGILTGVAIVVAVQVSGFRLAAAFPAWPAWITDLNVGIVALGANTAVALAFGLARRAPARAGA